MASSIEILENLVQFVLTPIALILQVAVLLRFRDPRNRDYPLATFYSFVLPLLTGIVYFVFSPFSALSQTALRKFADAYAGADLVMHLLLLALMLQLTQRSLKTLNQSPRVFEALASISIAVMVGATWYFLSDNGIFQAKFTAIRRYVSVTLVLLNLIWWTFLIRTRKVDRRILLLSAGIGLQMTGQVISDSLYAIGVQQREAGRMLMNVGVLAGILTHLMCLYAWLRAFSPVNAAAAVAPLQNEAKLAQ